MGALGADRARAAVEECLERLEASAEAQRACLLSGLQLSAAALSQAPYSGVNTHVGADAAAITPADEASAAAEHRLWWRCARLRVLQHLERLDTAVALMAGAWNPAAFASLRDCTVAEAATALAASGRLAALPVLLARHPRALLPSILDVLGAAPETLEAKQYAPLLRQLAGMRQAPPLPRDPDWVESTEVAVQLREAGRYALLLATEPMCAANDSRAGADSCATAGWHPPTTRQLARWVCQRAQQVDATTGMLPNAIALLEAGASALHYGDPSIASLLALAQELLSLIRLASSRSDGLSGPTGATWRMHLQQYASLVPAQRLSLLLGLLGSDRLADDLELTVAPFLARLGSTSSTQGEADVEADVDAQVVLRQALESEATKRLGWVVRMVQCEARRRAVFSSGAQLAKTAGACCYACQATDAWELLNSMLGSARDALRADTSLGEEEREAAAQGLASVRGHVTAARLLTKHGLTLPVSTVRDADRAAALRLLRTLLARVSRTKNTESRWVELWMDLRSIQEHGFGQLTEEDIRAELCRALLRVGQYRLCGTYLHGLSPEAAEQLVVTAGREAYLSASSMADPAVKQAKECFSLLPGSAAAREQLVGIAAAEQLQSVGLDLPPLQLQQLRSQAAADGPQVLEQLLREHPRLAGLDSGALGRLAEALGLQQQQQPLLLRAAQAAHAGGELRRAERLLLLLAQQHFQPAWQLAVTVAKDPRFGPQTRQQLLVFALAAAPPEQLLPLLVLWQTVDDSSSSGAAAGDEPGSAGGASGNGGSCWGLFSAGGAAADKPGACAEQQRWLARRLRMHLISLGRSSGGGGASSAGSGVDSEAAALGCLLALGPRGLQLWENLLSEQLPWPLGRRQRRRALLLGLTAAALLVLQPAELADPARLADDVAAAQARLAAPPAELLGMVQRQEQQGLARNASQGQLGRAGSEGSTPPPSGSASESGEAAGGSGGAGAAAAASSATAAAAAAAQRFFGLLLAAADAQQLQRLLPGVDAAAALAGGRASRRQLALQLAAAAGKPAMLRSGSGLAASGSGPCSLSLPSPRLAQLASESSTSISSPGGAALQRAASRKKVEDVTPGAAQPNDASPGSPAGSAWQRLDPVESREMVRQALALGARSGLAAWEVHLAFAESLLCHNQQQWGQPGSAAEQLLQEAVPQLLAGPAPAAQALLRTLLLRVWPRCGGRWPCHILCCLGLMRQCCEALAAQSGTKGGAGGTAPWIMAAAALGVCGSAAEQLLRAGCGLQAKLFLQPLVQLLATALPTECGDTSGPAQQAEAGPAVADPAALNEQLLLAVSSSNVAQLAAAAEQLGEQYAVAARALLGDAAAPAPFPCSGSSVYLALFIITVQAGGQESALSEQLARESLLHMSPTHAAHAAAFAAAQGPCPLVLPAGSGQPRAASLPEGQQQALLEAALSVLDSPAGTEALAADAALQKLSAVLRRRCALLAVYASIATACTAPTQLEAARMAAAALQHAAVRASSDQAGDDGATASSQPVLQDCLQQLLTSGCPAPGVLQAAAVLEALGQHPEQPPPAAQVALASVAVAAAAVADVAEAAEAAVGAALHAMSGGGASEAGAGPPAGAGEPLSAGDAVQNLFALLRSLHHLPEGEPGAEERGACEAEHEAVAALRAQVWQQLQQHAAAYDGGGGAAATEAHLQVLELLGSVGTAAMWPGWSPPAASLAPTGASASSAGSADDATQRGAQAVGRGHQRVLLFTRTAAMLAVEWPGAVQRCQLSAADFGSAEAAEGALLRLAAAAEGPQHLRLLLRLLLDGLADAFPTKQPQPSEEAASGPAETGAEGEADEPLAAPPAGERQAVAPLHRVWSTCLRMLLPFGDLTGALNALEEHAMRRQQHIEQQPDEQQRQRPTAHEGQRQQAPRPEAVLTEEQAVALLEAADATQGPVAAAALALLLEYRPLWRARWQQLLQACGDSSSRSSSAGDLAAAMPGLVALLLLLVQRQPGVLAELAAGGPQQQHLFKLLLDAALLQQQEQGVAAVYNAPLGSTGLTLRTAVAAAAAARLAAASQYTAAGWLAMHASGTPRQLRVLDSSTRVLQQLLRSCASGGAAAQAAAAAARDFADGAAPEGLALPIHAVGLLADLPSLCSSALDQMNAELQLQ